jgi:hypothetical protein
MRPLAAIIAAEESAGRPAVGALKSLESKNKQISQMIPETERTHRPRYDPVGGHIVQKICCSLDSLVEICDIVSPLVHCSRQSE